MSHDEKTIDEARDKVQQIFIQIKKEDDYNIKKGHFIF